MHNYTHKQLPTQFNNLWLKNLERRNIEGQIHDQDQEQEQEANNYYLQCTLCNDNDFYINFSRLSFSQKQPLILLPKTWNEFPLSEIKTLETNLISKIY